MRMRVLAIAIALPVAACASQHSDQSYLTCTGTSGIADNQAAIPYWERVITGTPSTEDASVSITADRIKVSASRFVSGDFAICSKSVDEIVFAPGCFPNDPDKLSDSGHLNRINGQLWYHFGDIVLFLKCRPARPVALAMPPNIPFKADGFAAA